MPADPPEEPAKSVPLITELGVTQVPVSAEFLGKLRQLADDNPGVAIYPERLRKPAARASAEPVTVAELLERHPIRRDTTPTRRRWWHRFTRR